MRDENKFFLSFLSTTIFSGILCSRGGKYLEILMFTVTLEFCAQNSEGSYLKAIILNHTGNSVSFPLVTISETLYIHEKGEIQCSYSKYFS